MPTELPLLRTSERGQFKRCPQRWEWGTLQGWGVAGPPDVKLWFGTQWHALMEYWYQKGKKRGKDPLGYWRQLIGEEIIKIRYNLTGNQEYKDEQYMGARELGEVMFNHYFDTYGKDESWNIIATEYKGEVLITHPVTNAPMVRYVFTFDGVYRDEADSDRAWLLEHKTAKAISTAHLQIDDQAGSYWAVAPTILSHQGIMKKGELLAGIMYNFARKSPPDDRPVNERGVTCNKPAKKDYVEALAEYFTPEEFRHMKTDELEYEAGELGIKVFGPESSRQPTSTLLRYPVRRTRPERNSQIRRIQSEFAVMDQYRTGKLPVFKTPTKDCSWDCDFYDACVLHERGSDWEEFMEGTMVKGDPYQVYKDKSASVSGDM